VQFNRITLLSQMLSEPAFDKCYIQLCVYRDQEEGHQTTLEQKLTTQMSITSEQRIARRCFSPGTSMDLSSYALSSGAVRISVFIVTAADESPDEVVEVMSGSLELYRFMQPSFTSLSVSVPLKLTDVSLNLNSADSPSISAEFDVYISESQSSVSDRIKSMTSKDLSKLQIEPLPSDDEEEEVEFKSKLLIGKYEATAEYGRRVEIKGNDRPKSAVNGRPVSASRPTSAHGKGDTILHVSKPAVNIAISGSNFGKGMANAVNLGNNLDESFEDGVADYENLMLDNAVDAGPVEFVGRENTAEEVNYDQGFDNEGDGGVDYNDDGFYEEI